jgi:hypothetical protein
VVLQRQGAASVLVASPFARAAAPTLTRRAAGGCHDELSGKRALEFAGRIAAWLLKKSEPRKEEQAAAAAGGDDKGAVAAPAGADEPRDA